MTYEQEKRVKEIVGKAATDLAEHFDSVRIFVTDSSASESNHWICYSEGRGNIYAQQGQVQEWLVRQEERCRIDTRNEENSREDSEE